MSIDTELVERYDEHHRNIGLVKFSMDLPMLTDLNYDVEFGNHEQKHDLQSFVRSFM